MLGYIFGRILALMMILLAVSVIVFALMHSVPGGPFDERKGRLPPAAKANILKKYGLDQPVWKQYINYMSHAVRFDFGIPYQRPPPPKSPYYIIPQQQPRINITFGIYIVRYKVLSTNPLTTCMLAGTCQGQW